MSAPPGTRSDTGSAARDDPSVLTIAATTLARLRRGPVLWVSVLLPVVLTLPLAGIALFSPEVKAGQQWETWQNTLLMFWGVLVPMLGAVYAALAARQDADARRLLFGYAFPRRRLFFGRFLALAAMGLACASLLVVLVGVPALVSGHAASLATLAAGVYLSWLAGLATLALAAFIADLWGFVAAICLGVMGMMFAALLADKSVWAFIPLAWPMRTVIPLGGFEASGVPLAPGNPLWDTSVIPIALALSAALTAAMLLIGGRYLDRKEL